MRVSSLDPNTLVADRLQTPLWIFDIERLAMVWANSAGMAFWGVDDLNTLCSRDFRAEISKSAQSRLHEYLQRFEQGETVAETWTFYPNGRPKTVRCLCSGYQLEESLGMLVEAQLVEEQDTSALRAQEALRHVPTLISIFDRQGHLLTQNPSARAKCSDSTRLAERFIRSSDIEKVHLWAAGKDESCMLEAPVRTTLGERWHRIYLQHMMDPVTGDRVIMVSETDITARVESDFNSRNARERLAALIRNLRGGILVEDEKRRLLLANQSFCDLFNIDAPPEALEGADCAEAAEQSKDLFQEPGAFIAGIDRAIEEREAITSELQMLDGRIFERTYVPVFYGNANLGHLWQYWDVTDQKNNLKRLESEAHLDPLTGLWNRRRFEQTLQETHEEAIRYNQPYSLVIVDIDHFKQVNDLHGHDAGDDALRLISEELSLRLRQSDRLSRWGGEEFVVLLPQTSLEGALRLANELRMRVRDLSHTVIGRITISLGVAEVGHNESPRQALRRADAALLQAKENGRDQVKAL